MIDLESGIRLGPFELLVELGRGGMASVWVAREVSRTSRKQRLVAVKVMLPELNRDPTFRSMFLDEGAIVSSIQHPHVVQVYGVAESQGLLYMAMEWVEGDSLRTLIKEARQRRPIPPEMAVRIIADSAAGLHAAHELRGWDGELRGIVHCDVSPHNILIGPKGVAKLVDFGVAHAVAKSEAEEGDYIKGKFGYMSPEQAQGRGFDRRSDIFAMGVVLFELTTGERLFRGRDPAHTLQLVSFGQIPRPSRLIKDYPERLEDIVMRALERDVDRRYQTADELREALEQYLVAERILVSVAGVGQLANRVLGPRIKKRRQAIRAALKQLGGPQTEVSRSSPYAVEPPPASQLTQTTGTASPLYADIGSRESLTAEEPRVRRSRFGYFVAVLALAAGAMATWVILNQTNAFGLGVPTIGQVTVGDHSGDGRVTASGASTEDALSNPGLAAGHSIDDLPPEQRTQYAARPRRPSRASSSAPAPAADPEPESGTREQKPGRGSGEAPAAPSAKSAPVAPVPVPSAQQPSAQQPSVQQPSVQGGPREDQATAPSAKKKPKLAPTGKCGCPPTDFACGIRCARGIK